MLKYLVHLALEIRHQFCRRGKVGAAGTPFSSALESSAGTLRGRKAEGSQASAETCIPPPLLAPLSGPGRQNFAQFVVSGGDCQGRIPSPPPPPALQVSSLQEVSGGWGWGGGAKVLEGCQGASGTTCISLTPAVLRRRHHKGKGLAPLQSFPPEPLAVAG